MKKVSAILLIFAISISLCACDFTDYSKAVKLLEQGQYEEAEKLFDVLGDYKDSSSLARQAHCELELQNAQSLMDDGKYQEAYAILQDIKDIADYPAAENLLNTVDDLIQEARLSQFRTIGNIIKFGEYEQDADQSNGKEPIEWIVLDSKDDHVFLLSRYVLDTHQYHVSDTEITWEDCELREWLNTTFYQDSFSDKERSAILLTEVDNGPEQGNQFGIETILCENTKDHIFLLSLWEVLHYFSSDLLRSAEATDYAIENKAVIGGIKKSEWYLRSPGYQSNYVFSIADIGIPGTIKACGGKFFEGDRPAMWVDISADGFRTAVLLEENFFSEYNEWVNAFENPGDARIGTTVQFGEYEQDADNSNGMEPIEWIVADVQDDTCLLISKYILDIRQYNKTAKPNTWEASNVRKWLNESFLNTAFNENEQKYILLTDVDNSPAQGAYFADSGNNTEDKVFLLSFMEASKYFPTDESRIATMTPNAYAVSGDEDIYGGWWTRSPYKWDGSPFIIETGELGIRGYITATRKSGIRPAIWVPVDALGL